MGRKATGLIPDNKDKAAGLRGDFYKLWKTRFPFWRRVFIILWTDPWECEIKFRAGQAGKQRIPIAAKDCAVVGLTFINE